MLGGLARLEQIVPYVFRQAKTFIAYVAANESAFTHEFEYDGLSFGSRLDGVVEQIFNDQQDEIGCPIIELCLSAECGP